VPGFFRAVRGGGKPDAASADDRVAAVTVSAVPADVARGGRRPHRELRPPPEPVLAGTCWRAVRGCRRRRPPAATRCRRGVARGRPGGGGPCGRTAVPRDRHVVGRCTRLAARGVALTPSTRRSEGGAVRRRQRRRRRRRRDGVGGAGGRGAGVRRPHRELRPPPEPVLAGTCWRAVRGCRRRRPPAATRCRCGVARGRPGGGGPCGRTAVPRDRHAVGRCTRLAARGEALTPSTRRGVRGWWCDAANAVDGVAAVTASATPGDVAQGRCRPHRERARPTPVDRVAAVKCGTWPRGVSWGRCVCLPPLWLRARLNIAIEVA